MPQGSRMALMAIGFYRKHLSAKKGYRCASGAAGARRTCSAEGLRIFKRAGLLKGLALLRRQFDRCALAADSLARARVQEASIESSFKAAARPRQALGGPLAGQAGFIDCAGCDAPSCDAPSCDLPDAPCKAPSCHMPSCSWPEMPSCGWSSPCSSANATSSVGDGVARSACQSAPWAFDCLPCDCGSWGGDSNSRARAAKERQERDQEAREERRAEKSEGAVDDDASQEDGA
jgi:putative component of membrane protein insertase Oxa1/YidC/SpoIIIJ protein YidD